MSEAKTQRIAERIDRETTALIPMKNSGAGMSLVPASMHEAMEFAKMMSVSGIMIRPQFRNNPGACLAIAQQAWRIGMDPFVVANKAYITRSKGGDENIGYEAQLVHAIVNTRAPLTRRLQVTYLGAGQDRQCKVVGWLTGEPDPLEYLSPKVKDIAVQNSPLWKADTDQQLHFYSVRAWARRHVPEVLMGVYTPEEIESSLEVDPNRPPLKDAPPPPKRGDFVDVEPEKPAAEEPRFAIVDQYGEERLYNAKGYLGAMLAALEGCTTVKALDAFWDTNSGQLAGAAEHGWEDLAAAVRAMYEARLAALHPVADPSAGAPPDPAASARHAAPVEQVATPLPDMPPEPEKRIPERTAPSESDPAPPRPAGIAVPEAPWPLYERHDSRKYITVENGRDWGPAFIKALEALGYSPSVSAKLWAANLASLTRMAREQPSWHTALADRSNKITGWPEVEQESPSWQAVHGSASA